jgi:hypothetical protein
MTYYPLTGKWKYNITRTGWITKGRIIGGRDSDGYNTLTFNYKLYRCARLAFFYMNGKWPNGVMDHKDRIKHNDKWENLRDTTGTINNLNRGLACNNVSGVSGVWLDKASEKFRACVKILDKGKKKTKSLGSFETFEEAVLCRWKAEQKYYNFKEKSSPAYQYLIKRNLILCIR